jgi:hypothetical protein
MVYLKMYPSDGDAVDLIKTKMEIIHATGAIQVLTFAWPERPSSLASAIHHED